MSDVMHGPSVTVGGKKRKAYLIAFIDDATRVVPYAAFALSENTAAFLPVLKDAVLRRGAPRRLLVDNGSAFRSHQLALAFRGSPAGALRGARLPVEGQPRRAASMAAMSIFVICIIASKARLAAAGSGSAIAALSARGVICHDSPRTTDVAPQKQ
jgi:hypothetical protein